MNQNLLSFILCAVLATQATGEIYGSPLVKYPARSYLLAPDSPTTPVKINPTQKSKAPGLILRDPILSEENRPPPLAQTVTPAKPKASRTGKKGLRLSKVKISGELTIPTVPFTPERIELPYFKDTPNIKLPTQVLETNPNP